MLQIMVTAVAESYGGVANLQMPPCFGKKSMKRLKNLIAHLKIDE